MQRDGKQTKKQRFKLPPLDTLVTRFMLLFVSALLVPGVSLALFASTQMQNQLAQVQRLQTTTLEQGKQTLVQESSTFYINLYGLFILSFLFACMMALLASRSMTTPLRALVVQLNQLSASVEKWSAQNSAMPTLEANSPIYELREVSYAFQNLLQAIRADVQWREEFIATLTHDLKIPLLATQQTLSYLQKGAYGEVSEPLLEVLKPLKQANGFSLDLIATLLDLYTYEAGKQTLRPEQTPVWPLLNSCFEEAACLATEKNIGFTLKALPAGEAASAVIDSLAFKRVFHNLLANAISHTPRYGTIHTQVLTQQQLNTPFVTQLTTLQASTLKQPVKVADTLFILIQDSGLGIERTRMEQLFQRFGTFRQGRNPMNIGLGLYHSYKVVQAHHGQLWIETTEGEGTAVIMALPMQHSVSKESTLHYERR